MSHGHHTCICAQQLTHYFNVKASGNYDYTFMNAVEYGQLEKVKTILAAGPAYKDFIDAKDYVGGVGYEPKI